MVGLNKSRQAAPRTRTFEGALAMIENPIAALERVLFAHMLFEDTFYMDGKDTASLLTDAVKRAVDHDPVATAASILDARQTHNIRHASLLAAVVYAKHVKGKKAIALITDVIQRADELAEVLVMASKEDAVGVPHMPLSIPSAVRKGVRHAFNKFDAYQFGKYQGTGKLITLRGAVFLTHPSPEDQPLITDIVEGTLATPDTWEVGLSAGGNKCETFTRLLTENKLGSMALLRNLRNMHDAGVDRGLIKQAMQRANWSRVLPFRFMSAAINAPWAAQMLDDAFRKAVSNSVYLQGRTAVLLDTSGSMGQPVSEKSIVRAYQAGAALAAAINGDHVDLYQWASRTKQMANWGSLSTAMNISPNQVGMGTNSVQAVEFALDHGKYDRMIMISDMQFAEAGITHGSANVPAIPSGVRGYTINVSPYAKAGLMHGNWTHLSGWSDSVLKYIASIEQ